MACGGCGTEQGKHGVQARFPKATSTLNAVILTDSRGSGLQHIFDETHEDLYKYKVKVLMWKGKGITEATKLSLKYLIWSLPDIIIVAAGICDLTVLNRDTRQVSLNFTSQFEAVDMFTGRMDAVNHFLSINLREKKYQLIFAPVIGMNISTYNCAPFPSEQQDLLDNSVLAINSEIAAWNQANEVVTPWITSEIHHNRKKGRKITRYDRLASDGLHLTDNIRDKWVAQLRKTIEKMIG